MSSLIRSIGAEVPVQSPNAPIYPTADQVVLKSELGTLSGPLVQSGVVMLSSNGQTVVLPTPYATTMSVVVQGTSNAAGVNGFFTVATYGSLSQFQIFYSGELIYGPIQMFWIAVGDSSPVGESGPSGPTGVSGPSGYYPSGPSGYYPY
jgi:hypothetical protein